MKVLSVFDGISCGRVALERAGVPIDAYYASEIEPSSIAISKKNYPDIIQLGDVTKWREWDIPWGEIDLLIGGSPCQGFSFAGKKLNFDDPRSKLFFVYVDILNHIKKHNPQVKFLLENVVMREDHKNVITERLGCDPVLINSNLFSAQNRPRLYWCNFEIPVLPVESSLTLRDVFDPDVKHREIHINHPDTIVKCKSYYQYDQNRRGHNSQDQRFFDIDSKSNTLLLSSSSIPKVRVDDGRVWLLTPSECAKLQTLDGEYLNAPGVSNAAKYGALGNGWTVDVISHILKGLVTVEKTARRKWLDELLGDCL
jgi:DNA (cytosine-5)-methyltransferase 3A